MHSYLTTQNKSFFLIKGGTPSVLHQHQPLTGTQCNKCSFEICIGLNMIYESARSIHLQLLEQLVRLECPVMTCPNK